MHRQQQAGLHRQGEVIRAGVKEHAHAGIHREESYVDVFALKVLDLGLEVLVRLLNLPGVGDLPPVPEIQVARVEEFHAVQGDQEGHARVGGAVRLHMHPVGQGQLAALGHAVSTRLFRQGVGDHVGHRGVLIPGVHQAVVMILVLVGDKDIHLIVAGEGFRRDSQDLGKFAAHAAPIVKHQQHIAAGHGESAVVVVGHIHHLAHT